MGIPSLLWACPLCGEDRGLEESRGEAVCRACGARYRRVRGANIRAERPDGASETHTPAEWLDRLPTPEDILQAREEGRPIRVAAAEVAEVTGEEVVRVAGEYLNRVEVWGDERPGTVELWPDRLIVSLQGGESRLWPLDSLTAVQTSSKSLQLKRRNEPLTSFRFLDDASFFWERLLRAALRDLYGRTGRGEIAEFQPRITTR